MIGTKSGTEAADVIYHMVGERCARAEAVPQGTVDFAQVTMQA
jgi:hypothetical protein